MHEMNWAEITIQTTWEGAEAVSEALLRAGASGTAVEDSREFASDRSQYAWDYVDDSLCEQFSGATRVIGYFAEDERLPDTIAALRQDILAMKRAVADVEGYDLGGCAISVNQVREQDWANEWKKYYKPTHIGRSLVVRPSWEAYQPREGERVIEVDPGMAFGTGIHETTRMCLILLEKYLKQGDACIDIGCGTAILGIAAALLGGSEVLAIDFDPVAVEAAQGNIERNGVQDRVRAMQGDLLHGVAAMPSDILLVNIVADVIIGLMPGLGPFLKEDGVIIASGIIRERADEVRDAIDRAGYEVVEELNMGEWFGMACKRKAAGERKG